MTRGGRGAQTKVATLRTSVPVTSPGAATARTSW